MIALFSRKFSRFCHGCGVIFQHSNMDFEGYIQENKYKNMLIQNVKAENTLKDMKYHGDVNRKDFKTKKSKEILLEEVSDIEEIEERMKTAVPMHEIQEKPKIRPVVCMRCFKLSKYGKIPQVDCIISHKSPLKSLQDIFDPIKHNSIILKVVDIIDFNGSFIQEIYQFAKEKKCHMLLILNKIDALPLGYKDTRIFQWAIMNTRGLFEEMHVCAVSSRTGDGFDRALKLLKKLKTELPDSKYYVIGATNSGKSSFINKLSEKCWNLPLEKYKKPLHALTTSSLPGTTLHSIEISLRSLDIQIIDTPGIPTLSQLTFKLRPDVAQSIIPSKKIKPIVLIATPEFSFWIGGLVRIDMLEGDFKYLTFFTSHLCTIHKTKRELVEDVFRRQNGKLLYPSYKEEVVWAKHLVEVECHTDQRASKDIVVHGLGWVSITGTGKVVFEVYVAEGVGFNLREPIMPYEAEPYKVKSTRGRTINSEKVTRNK